MANLSSYLASLFGGTVTDDVSIKGGVVSKADAGTIPHGLGVAPTRYGATSTAAGHIVSVTAVDATNLTIALKTDAGAAVSSPENVSWWAAA